MQAADAKAVSVGPQRSCNCPYERFKRSMRLFGILQLRKPSGCTEKPGGTSLLTLLPSFNWILLKTDPGFSVDFLQDTNEAPPAPRHVTASFVHEVSIHACIH